MTKKHLAKLTWSESSSKNAYLYGSTITFLDDGVLFNNNLFPSGKTIIFWQSQTNYQGDRKSPELPLLIAGTSYQLVAHLKTAPQNRAIVRLDFFNRLGERIAFEVMHGEELLFTYPEAAFSYTMNLIGAGCERVHFQAIDMYQVTESHHLLTFAVKTRKYKNLPEELRFVSPLLAEEKGSKKA